MTTAAANTGMTEQLAQWISEQTFDSLPAAVKVKAADVIFESVAHDRVSILPEVKRSSRCSTSRAQNRNARSSGTCRHLSDQRRDGQRRHGSRRRSRSGARLPSADT
jgi:hypothetical protein